MSDIPGDRQPGWLQSLRGKIVMAICVVTLIVVAAVVGVSTHFRNAELLEEFQVFVRGVAGTTALALSGDEFKEIRMNGGAPADPSSSVPARFSTRPAGSTGSLRRRSISCGRSAIRAKRNSSS